MTGGQLGPTTLLGQVTTTSPTGRNTDYYGYPIKIAEHVALCDGTAFAARVSLDTVANIRKAKQAIKKHLKLKFMDLVSALLKFSQLALQIGECHRKSS